VLVQAEDRTGPIAFGGGRDGVVGESQTEIGVPLVELDGAAKEAGINRFQ